MAERYRGALMESVPETAEGLVDAGVTSQQTMRQFDEACLTPVRPLAPAEVRALREHEGASQAVFARSSFCLGAQFHVNSVPLPRQPIHILI